MKKRTFNSKLEISKKTISNFDTDATKGGGIRESFDCPPSHNMQCTFVEACFSKGDGCSRWQVC